MEAFPRLFALLGRIAGRLDFWVFQENRKSGVNNTRVQRGKSAAGDERADSSESAILFVGVAPVGAGCAND